MDYGRFKGVVAEHGMTIQQLLDATGIPRSRVADWSQGRGVPKVGDHIAIARALDMTAEEFYERTR